MRHRAVFLDRDGTVIEKVDYLDRIERIRVYPWSIEAISSLNRAGFRVVVVTNQSGVARGYFDESFVRRTHCVLDRVLRAGGARIDGYYYCPHHPEAGTGTLTRVCRCRKPGLGLIHQAARDLRLDLARSVVVGDRWLDIQLAQAVGVPGLLVRTGHGTREEASPLAGVEAAAVVDDLRAAAVWIRAHARRDETLATGCAIEEAA